MRITEGDAAKTRATVQTRIGGIFAMFICPITLLLSGCSGESRYPPSWPPLENKLRVALPGYDCPNLNGTYDYDAMADENSTFGTRSTFLGANITEQYGERWHAFTIAGDAAKELTITFEGMRKRPGDETSSPLKETVTASRGYHYKCDGGWVVGKSQAMFLQNPRQNDSSDNQNRTGRPVDLQNAWFRLDSEGSLVARADVREARVLSLWAETGAGVPYWFDVNTYWARWQDTGDRMASPAVQARIAREVYEKENGVSADAAAARVAPSAPAPLPPPIEMPSKQVTAQDFQALVQHINDGATLEGVGRQGERIVLRLRITESEQITSTIKSLSEDKAFTDVQNHGTIAGANKTQIATISLKQR